MLENDHTMIDTPDELGQVDQKKGKNYQAYILRYHSDQAVSTNEWSNSQFILQEISGQPPQLFDSFEQVMNFLLDELLKYKDRS